jgi:hypothetical protein
VVQYNLLMAKKPDQPKTTQTAFERFTEASRELFNLPKETVQKTIAKYPAPKKPKTTAKRRQHPTK